MNLSFALPAKLLDRKSRFRRRKPAVASRLGMLRRLGMEPLEDRRLLSLVPTLATFGVPYTSPLHGSDGNADRRQCHY